MLFGLVAASVLALASNASGSQSDPIGDFLHSVAMQPVTTQSATAAPETEAAGPELQLHATLYHAGASGVGNRDSLGCRVVPMRTVATDPKVIPRRSILFIKETVGMELPDGGAHDGIWYASDTGGAIKGQRIDLYSGSGSGSMKAFYARGINKGVVKAKTVGQFDGCPQERRGTEIAAR